MKRKTNRLKQGRMADGWCKGERNKKMNKECYRTALHNIQSSEGPLKQRGDETSCACWQCSTLRFQHPFKEAISCSILDSYFYLEGLLKQVYML